MSVQLQLAFSDEDLEPVAARAAELVLVKLESVFEELEELRLVDRAKAAALLDCSPETVRRMDRRGALHPVVLPGGGLRYELREIRALTERGKTELKPRPRRKPPSPLRAVGGASVSLADRVRSRR